MHSGSRVLGLPRAEAIQKGSLPKSRLSAVPGSGDLSGMPPAQVGQLAASASAATFRGQSLRSRGPSGFLAAADRGVFPSTESASYASSDGVALRMP